MQERNRDSVRRGQYIMKRSIKTANRIGGLDAWIMVAPTVIATLLIVVATPAQAQTYTVLHTFTSGTDGAYPLAAVTMDGTGTLYGTASGGGYTAGDCGSDGCGTVFKLTQHGSGWLFAPLYSFTGSTLDDGAFPSAPVIVGPDGALYGTTSSGGNGHGTVFRLTPPASLCKGFSCPWTETVLYRFLGGNDGAYPGYGPLVFDQAGNIYGTTQYGVPANLGTVFKLTPSHGGRVESILYGFTAADGGQPLSGVIFDSAGNLYGTASVCCVYELSPSQSGWQYQNIYGFQGGRGGTNPTGGVVFDSSGNLYGTTFNDGGTAYVLRPSNGTWNLTTLYSFNAYAGPLDTPTLDAEGNIYGTVFDLVSGGIVFKLTRSNGWLESTVTDFGGFGQPAGSVILDANGNIYGTIELGGTDGYGAVFEVTP
jgi:uncharacterized repeat protein (TIGR03803 family)